MLHMFPTVRLHILARIRTTKAARAHRPDIREMWDLQAAGGFDASRLDPGGPDGLLRDRSADRGPGGADGGGHVEGIEGAVNATRSLIVVVKPIVAAAAEVVVLATGVGDGATDALTRVS